MPIFDTILEKLGMKKPSAPAATPTPPPAQVQGAPYVPPTNVPYRAPTYEIPGHTSTGQPMSTPTPSTPPPPPPAPAAMNQVDLTTHLDYLAKTGPIQGLNWRMSINDFMALLGMDHSPEAIKNLAIELGCPEKEMMDSYSRNVWTHAELMKKLAENGGKLPPELLK